MLCLPPRSTLFPYTTLFRSHREHPVEPGERVGPPPLEGLERQLGVGAGSESHPLRFELALEFREVVDRSEEHTSELQSLTNLVCRLLLEKKKDYIKKQ